MIEREFLRLAGNYLACRLEVMGGRVRGVRFQCLGFSLLGLIDYRAEMRLLCAEARQ